MEVVAELESGREAYSRRAWRQAHEALTVADQSAQLGSSDLELLATSSYMLGLEQEYRQVLERAYRAYLDAEEPQAAVRCAIWIAVNLAVRGELGHAGGWLGRAERLLEREGNDRVERGYLLIPRIIEQEAQGELERAAASAAEAAAIGERFGDPDLLSLAAHAEGSIMISLGGPSRRHIARPALTAPDGPRGRTPQ